ncbi:MAG TPA: glycerate kinase [Streptosporangiaceae bacterium]|jgi:glycerate kinase|nr:glycerate kinase [Streptosporangiaceae bacterium]
MKVVIAPDSFKGSIAAADAADALAAGWLDARPGDEVIRVPLADGGEGTLDVLAAANPSARRHQVRVSGPAGHPVDSGWLELPGRTAAVELASSSGLPLMPRPDPLGAHTTGLGEVIAHALGSAAGMNRLLIALGGSASTDGATGALAALGARFLDEDGRPVPAGGGGLPMLAAVDLTGLRPPPRGGVACLADVTAPLLGPAGAAAVFAPQKGADAEQVAQLETGLARLASLLGGDPDAPGAGAAGGTGYGFAAAWGAVITPGAQELCRLAGLEPALRGASLVITGEGRYDRSSGTGKAPGAVLAAAAVRGLPAALVAGAVAADPPAAARDVLSLADLAGGQAAAVREPARWLREAGRRLAGLH